MKKQTLITFIILLALGAACSKSPAISKEDQVATVVAGTLTAQPPIFIPVPTSTAISIPTQAASPAVTISGPYYIHTTAQNVNLRTLPGTLFKVSRVMEQGTRLQVFGLSPGGEWVYVLNDEGINGWVGISFVDEFPVGQFPSVEPGNVQRISGRVLDANGLPVSGIGFAIEQNTASASLRTDSVADASGTFYAFLPQTASGVWTVSYVSISCASNITDANCQCKGGPCGEPDPKSISVTLPATGQLNFIWK